MLDLFRYHAGQFSVALAEVRLLGEDVESFLQSQSTFEINSLLVNTFHLVSFLDPQGRVECYGWLTRSDKSFALLVPPLLVEQTLIRLNKFLVSEDVEILPPENKSFHILIGPEAQMVRNSDAFEGVIFDEQAFIQTSPDSNFPIVSNDQVHSWRGLSGWPSFDGADYQHSIINNLRLFDLCVSLNKGCYPGQETVSKIATRRGAAYFEVLVEVDKKLETGDLYSFEKKIGTASGCFEWKEKFYLSATLLRDFRVDGMKFHFSLNNEAHDGIVRYYPLLHGDKKSKAKELYYSASEYFKQDKLDKAEECFKLSIKLDPGFADAYESLGVMLGRLERFDEAITLMNQLSEVDPKSVLAHTNLSLFLMKLGKITEAEEQKSLATIKSFQSFGDDAKNKEIEEIQKEKQQLEWSQRESMFLQVLEIDPEDTLANYGIGSIAVERNDWNKARLHLEKVIEQDPKYSVAYLALGKALKGLGLNLEAKTIWQEGIKIAAAKGDLMPANQMQQELNFL